ncbi:MAG: phosphoketolase [Nocardioides sp.]|jgi:phosphoketolase|uniref:phosphoketolase family protein n=1 Tax=Nocardioides sp. TaxID=35761 RepID=UPI002629C19F|nr:hypothetical protein [Nocardioides sp.]MCW2834535.1 phosphoketolase [Nocardioides sp.]
MTVTNDSSTAAAARPLAVGPLTPEALRLLDAYRRAANYLSVGQIYLLANPMLREPLLLEQVKPRLLGHWGTTPGVRVVNVVDIMRLEPDIEHPHGLPDTQFDALFTADRQVVFAYHGYPSLIHRLAYRRTNHANIHVRGFKEEGTTTTPVDILMLNDLDRFHLVIDVIDVIDRVPSLGASAGHLRQRMVDERLRARAYTRAHGKDDPAITDWTWPYGGGALS